MMEFKLSVAGFGLKVIYFFLLIGILVAGSGAFGQEEVHDHAPAIPEMDGDGKRLDSYQVRHRLDEQTLAQLQEKVSLYKVLSKPQIELSMSSMGPNYAWYVSDLAMMGDIGILILAHGSGENSDRILTESVELLGTKWPTAIAFGMAMMTSTHIDAAIQDLKARGVKRIVIVPVTSATVYNSLTRQWQYIFGMYDESSYLSVPQLSDPDIEFIMTEHYGEHPLITEILYDHVKEVSTDPANEMVIIVGHGPEELEDNVSDMKILQAHVDRIAAKNEFVDVRAINLMDDAIPAIRETNVRQLRRWVQTATRQGQKTIIVSIVTSAHAVQAHIRNDLRNLDYVFADKGMSQHINYTKWIELAVEDAIAKM